MSTLHQLHAIMLIHVTSLLYIPWELSCGRVPGHPPKGNTCSYTTYAYYRTIFSLNISFIFHKLPFRCEQNYSCKTAVSRFLKRVHFYLQKIRLVTETFKFLFISFLISYEMNILIRNDDLIVQCLKNKLREAILLKDDSY